MSRSTCSECGCSKCLEPSTNPVVSAGSIDGNGPKGTVRRPESVSASSCLERTAGGPATRRLTLVLMLSRKSR